METLGGWHDRMVGQVKRLGSALARHTGWEEGEWSSLSWFLLFCSLWFSLVQINNLISASRCTSKMVSFVDSIYCQAGFVIEIGKHRLSPDIFPPSLRKEYKYSCVCVQPVVNWHNHNHRKYFFWKSDFFCKSDNNFLRLDWYVVHWIRQFVTFGVYFGSILHDINLK